MLQAILLAKLIFLEFQVLASNNEDGDNENETRLPTHGIQAAWKVGLVFLAAIVYHPLNQNSVY